MAAVSSLLKSAASVRSQLSTYQDSLQAFEYSNSAHTDSALSTYQAYLQSRIDSLQSSGSIGNASKALSLTKALDGATKANISSTITRENIQMMAGNASLTDKYNVISQQFVRAQANGDMTLAQSLMSQAYSVSQTLQVQHQDAANAAVASGKAAAAVGAKNQGDVGTTIQKALDQFNTDYANAGRKSADKVMSDFVQKMEPTFKALGISLQPGSQPNYFDIVTGANNAVITAYKNAYTIAAPTAADGGQSWVDKGVAAATKISTIYGTMDQKSLAAAAANPNAYGYSLDPQYAKTSPQGSGGKQNPQTGYSIDPQSNITPTFASTPWVQIPTNLNNQIQALHLNVINKQGSGIEVAPSNQTPQWLQNIFGTGNATTHIISDPNGNLQFEADSVHGQGKAVYTIAKDNSVWESSNVGDRQIFNPHEGLVNTMNGTPGQTGSGRSSFGFGNFENNMSNWFGGLTGHASAEGLLNSATSGYKAPPPIPVNLPPISIAAPTSLPTLNMAPNRPASQPVNPYPVNIQAPASNIQAPSSGVSSIQGAAGGIQSGGTGSSFSSANNGAVGFGSFTL